MFDTPEAKAALQEAIETATTALAAKNKELLGELKEARKGQTIDPATVEKLEAKIESLSGELITANKAAKDATKAAETATKALATETGFTSKLLIDNGLVGELTKHGVTNPVHLKAAQAMLRGSVQIVADGESRVAKVGDKLLADMVKEWAASDEGKFFVQAPNNSGGGAGGGGGKSGGKTMTRAEFDTKTAAGDASIAGFFKEGGTLTE
jgi:uncharacterized phage infection (PIP) family protein YhgE